MELLFLWSSLLPVAYTRPLYMAEKKIIIGGTEHVFGTFKMYGGHVIKTKLLNCLNYCENESNFAFVPFFDISQLFSPIRQNSEKNPRGKMQLLELRAPWPPTYTRITLS